MLVRNKVYKTYQAGHVTIRLTSFCVTLHCTNQDHWDCHWLGVKHCGSHKQYECALCRILLSLMFKIRWTSRETVALSSLLGCLTQALHDQCQKRTSSNDICQPVSISTRAFARFVDSMRYMVLLHWF